MATETDANNIYDPDAEIGFDMRNAQMYNDSDDDEENVERHSRPRPYAYKDDSNGCGNCCYFILVIIVIVLGSVIGYSIGSSYTIHPKQYNPETDPPIKSQTQNTMLKIHITPSPTFKDPFHAQTNKLKPTQKPTPKPSTTTTVKPVAFEPTVKAFEPTIAVKKVAFEPTVAKKLSTNHQKAQKNNVEIPTNTIDGFDMNAIQKVLNDKKYDLEFKDIVYPLPDKSAIENSSILTKIVLDGYEIPHIFEDSHRFNLKYPKSKKKYASNEYRTWCFHFYLFEYPNAQIAISFNKFQFERGFDRILIRHFNQSFIDPPTVIAGRGLFGENDANKWLLPETVTYHLQRNEFKSLCVEMQSDDSVNLQGIDFNVDIKYDDCEWSELSECFIGNEAKQHWDRGPFYDGLCGIGIQKRTQNNTKTEVKSSDAFVKCDNTKIDGPYYCLKAPCENIDNFHNPNGIPSNIRYGWTNKTLFYNGYRTLTPQNPNLYQIQTANPSTPTSFDTINSIKSYMLSPSFLSLYQSYPKYHINPNGHSFDLESIMDKLQQTKKQILSEHIDEHVLTMPILKLEHTDKTMQWLGARLTHSLLIGRPFTMIFTGSSNTAGHDNQFQSTYSMQLQSRLRSLWSSIGTDGAAMNIRNEAVGGAPNTATMAWHIHARSSETVSYPFNDFDNLSFYRNEDVIFWESFMNDGGRPPGTQSEEQLRNTALLNAIFGAMESIGEPRSCNAANDLKFDQIKAPKHLSNVFRSFSDIYGEHMGIIEMDPKTFLNAVCTHAKYTADALKMNWHPNAGGHRCEADIYAYLLLDAAINFMKANEKVINDKKMDKNVGKLDNWLVEMSGNWRKKYIESIKKQDFSIFPAPKYCKPFCDKTVAPFTLKTSEPNEWDVGFRLSDYIIYDYALMNNETTGHSVDAKLKAEGVDVARIPDLQSKFCTEKLVRANGWTYIDTETHDPPHYPQDMTAKLGSMDRKSHLVPNKLFWIEQYKAFLKEKKKSNEDMDIFAKINDRNKNLQAQARKIYGKYPEEWAHYILMNNLDAKVAFMVPKIGNHSILAFTEEGGKSFYDTSDDGIIGINLQRMDGELKGLYAYDYSKRLTEQRKCVVYDEQKGCVFHNISPGKYVMRYYPINMTKSDVPGLVQIVAF